MRYDILNSSGSIEAGELGRTWTAYSIDDKGNVNTIATVESASEKLTDQLIALYGLVAMIVKSDNKAMLKDLTITGESLSLSPKTQSPIKQWILSKMESQ